MAQERISPGSRMTQVRRWRLDCPSRCGQHGHGDAHPYPEHHLDLLLSASITVSVLVLIVSMYIERPVQFSVFPSLLLLLTLFRLSLNLASSRRILLHGGEGSSAAAGMSLNRLGSLLWAGIMLLALSFFWP